MKKILLLASVLLAVNAVTYADESNEQEKKFKITTGMSHQERQQGRISGKAYNAPYVGADDLEEDGDVTSIYTGLEYNINERWSLSYTYEYLYIKNNDQFGRYKEDGRLKRSDKDSAQKIAHTLNLTRSFNPFLLLNQQWNSFISWGVQDSRESSIRGNGEYTYEGDSEKHLLFNAGMSTDLTEKTSLNLAYDYDFITYNQDGGEDDPNTHEHYFTLGLDHEFNDSWYGSFANTLFIEDSVGESDTAGEWNYELVLGTNIPLENGYNINLELVNWAEINLFRKGAEGVDRYDDQGEISFIPKLEKTFEFEEDLEVYTYIGAGYVYGYEPNHNRKQYSGFEGVVGVEASYLF